MRGILGIHRRSETSSDVHESSRRSSWEFIVLELIESCWGGQYTALLGIADYARGTERGGGVVSRPAPDAAPDGSAISGDDDKN